MTSRMLVALQVKGQQVEAIIRQGLRKFKAEVHTEHVHSKSPCFCDACIASGWRDPGLLSSLAQVGRLWCSLADYFIRLGHFEKVTGQ